MLLELMRSTRRVVAGTPETKNDENVGKST
jgi:hypothetical protein